MRKTQKIPNRQTHFQTLQLVLGPATTFTLGVPFALEANFREPTQNTRDPTMITNSALTPSYALMPASRRSAITRLKTRLTPILVLSPPPYRVGLLYDIGCQTKRSCIKWGFLDRYIERIIFGISVFHAFGHQWYHQHLYTLDCQVDHTQRETLENLGAWLLHRSRHALTKRKVAESILWDCGKSETELQAEWKDQVETQTKPLL
ncbi:hypothetical protein DXG01_002083, partial [Tephrocybe rancida]